MSRLAHIGLNLVYLVPGETGGMEVYARELVPRLAAARPDLRLTAFAGVEAASALAADWRGVVEVVEVPVRASNRLQWVRGEQLLLPRLADRAGVQLLHSLATTSPARGRAVRVTTVHDLIYRSHPDAHFGLRALGMRVLVPLSARRSQRLIAISQATRDDLVASLGVRAGKIDVVPNGVGAAFVEPSTEASLRERLALGSRPVVLSLSARRPHKNLERLIDAWSTLDPAERPVLVLPGYPTPHEHDLRERSLAVGVGGDVRFPGWLAQPDVEGLYALAKVVVVPSLIEGFGLPVLEAMMRGVPVACSGRGALLEIAGGAAALFNPEDSADISATVGRLLDDSSERARLAALGRDRASSFTWEACAEGTLASYDRAFSDTLAYEHGVRAAAGR